jgi:hypothetical protein
MILHRGGHAAVNAALVGALVLCALVSAMGCQSTKACKDGTLLVTVSFQGATSAADTVAIDVSIASALPTHTSLSRKPDSSEGSIELDFPHGDGYPAGKPIDVTVTASKGTTTLATKTVHAMMLPPGCGLVDIVLKPPMGDGSVSPDAPSGQPGIAGGGGASGIGGSAGSSGSAGAGVDAGPCGAPMPDYNKTCGSCGGVVRCDGSCTVVTPTTYNSVCGSCGGKIGCDGNCTIATPATYNSVCGSCGGKIGCDGNCTIATPATYNSVCGSCGGKIGCDGNCTIATPATYNSACGSCGGKINCAGTCSVTTPTTYNNSCNSCGGHVQCDGSCSPALPAGYNNSCNSCGGHVQCDGSCSPASPGNFNAACGCNSAGQIECDGMTCNGPSVHTWSASGGQTSSYIVSQTGVNALVGTFRPSIPNPNNAGGLTYTLTFNTQQINNCGTSATKTLQVSCSSGASIIQLAASDLAGGAITRNITCPIADVVNVNQLAPTAGQCCGECTRQVTTDGWTATNAQCY